MAKTSGCVGPNSASHRKRPRIAASSIPSNTLAPSEGFVICECRRLSSSRKDSALPREICSAACRELRTTYPSPRSRTQSSGRSVHVPGSLVVAALRLVLHGVDLLSSRYLEVDAASLCLTRCDIDAR